MTVMELVQRYLAVKTGVKPNTRTNYNFIVNLLAKDPFSQKPIGKVKMSDAKLWLVKMQSEGRDIAPFTASGVLYGPLSRWQSMMKFYGGTLFNFEMKEIHQ